MHIRNLKILPFVLLFLFGILQYCLWFESGGILDMLRLKKQLSLQMQNNEKLKKYNEKLIREVQYMQTHPDAVEPKARAELGMIKKGETFYNTSH